jgi:hypothetical protein
MGMGFFDVSLDTANQFYAWGWRASVAGALFTSLGVGFLFWGTRVRDQDFEENIAALHDRAAFSEERSAALEKETARITANNLELATNLERERAARAQIEAGLASRHVSAEQKAALIAAMKGVKLTLVISTYSDPEASAYSREVTAAFQAAGQEVQQGSVVMASGGPPLNGLLVEETSDSRLISALIAARLVTHKMASTENDMLWTGKGLNAVVVGIKPSPF